MPIRIICSSCNKKLQVKDELLGKRVKCPACGSAIVAAAAADTSAAVRAETPPPLREGKRGEQAGAKPAMKKPAPPERTRPDRDEEDDEPAPRKRKKKAAQKSSKALWIGIAAAALVLVLGVGGYFLFFHSPTPSGPVAKGKGGVPGGTVPKDPAKKAAPTSGAIAQGASSLADLVPGDAWAFGTLSADLYNAPGLALLRGFAGANVEQEFQKNAGFPFADLDRVAVFTVADFGQIMSNPNAPPVVIAILTKKPVQREAVTAAYQNSDGGKKNQMVLEFLSDRIMVVGARDMLALYKAKKGKSQPSGVLARALSKASTSKGLVVSVVVPPEAVPLAAGALKDAPPYLQPLLKVKEALVSIDITENLMLDVALITEDAAGAQEIKTTADNLRAQAAAMLEQFAKDPQMAGVVPLGRQALKDLKLDLKGQEVTVGFQTNASILAALVIPAIEKVRGAASNVQDINNFKQIALGWHNYESVFKSMPPQTLNKGLSWRVAMLPFIEQDQLFKRFKLDEPWDSPNNIKLLPLMPESYKLTARPAEAGFTYIQTFVGANTINKNPKKSMKLSEIKDGTSNTLIFAEAERAVEWTKPDDITVAPGQPIALGGGDAPTFLAAFGDAHVQRLRRNLGEKILRLLIDPADGNPIPNFD